MKILLQCINTNDTLIKKVLVLKQVYEKIASMLISENNVCTTLPYKNANQTQGISNLFFETAMW
jgi:hypothetical protein